MISLMQYYNTMDELTNKQLGELVIELSSENTPRSMFTKVSLELAKRFVKDINLPDSTYITGNASQGEAAGRRTKVMRGIEERYNG